MKPMAKTKKCGICGREFIAILAQKFCSNECVRVRQKKRQQEQRIVKTCTVCHREFIATIGKKVCSQQCFDVRFKEDRQQRSSLKRSLKNCVACHRKFMGTWQHRYCSVHCRSVIHAHAQAIKNGCFVRIVACSVCGIPIQKAGREPRKTCSAECANEATRKRSKERQKHRNTPKPGKHCVVCGQVFQPRGSAVTCGVECSNENKRRIGMRWYERFVKNHESMSDVACSVLHATIVLTQHLERITNHENQSSTK